MPIDRKFSGPGPSEIPDGPLRGYASLLNVFHCGSNRVFPVKSCWSEGTRQLLDKCLEQQENHRCFVGGTILTGLINNYD